MLYSRARAPEQLQGGVAAVNVKIDIGVSPEQLQGGVAAVNVRILESHRSSSRAASPLLMYGYWSLTGAAPGRRRRC